MCGLQARRYQCVGSGIEGTLAGYFLSKTRPAPVCAFTFAIFLLKIGADVRYAHRMDSPARFKLILRGILMRKLCIAKLSWPRQELYTVAPSHAVAKPPSLSPPHCHA